uniref:Uncharacterized protein n=1 Tax=Oryza sativa subsp. japonica TaxID=39947 RepID=Q6K9E2_ORYSJ|nr:hypothetical protein [Oryza sativa Japonica Group]
MAGVAASDSVPLRRADDNDDTSLPSLRLALLKIDAATLSFPAAAAVRRLAAEVKEEPSDAAVKDEHLHAGSDVRSRARIVCANGGQSPRRVPLQLRVGGWRRRRDRAAQRGLPRQHTMGGGAKRRRKSDLRLAMLHGNHGLQSADAAFLPPQPP